MQETSKLALASRLPRWFRPMLLVLSAALLLGWFSPEISDPDFWWHLKTGQYILQNRSLPVPDPFAYTTAMGTPAYAGEPRTRYFNLTHEWLAQVLLYVLYRAGGFGAVVLFRAVLLSLVCGIVGWVVWHRCGGFYRALAAAFASAGVLSAFAADRPFVITFLFLALTIAILESTRESALPRGQTPAPGTRESALPRGQTPAPGTRESALQRGQTPAPATRQCRTCPHWYRYR